MNRLDDQLNRLFRAAARAETKASFAPPYGLETRVMAAWREGGPVAFWDTPLLVRGLILATIILAVSLWPMASQTTNPFADYLQLADSTVQVDNSP